MNWFQIVFLREDSQVVPSNTKPLGSCELISNCIFTWGFTSTKKAGKSIVRLWIDFKLYFYVRIHKLFNMWNLVITVVNWFQIVFLREDSQGNEYDFLAGVSCELISNCIFTWGFTSFNKSNNYINELWIDFKLYFYVRIHKLCVLQKTTYIVVNWFQIVFLREDSQERLLTTPAAIGCELISNCIFTWGFTSFIVFFCVIL